jgi:hypothetical protein
MQFTQRARRITQRFAKKNAKMIFDSKFIFITTKGTKVITKDTNLPDGRQGIHNNFHPCLMAGGGI